MCARLPGTISLSSPTSAFPVATTRFSPLAVNESSVVPVCRPFRDHSVSPCRMTNTRGSGIVIIRRSDNVMEDRRTLQERMIGKKRKQSSSKEMIDR
jgi:hypothetical protein